MEIQEIKQQLRIEEVLNHYGLQANKNEMLNCPFHNDKTPSMQVYPKTDTCYCFSGNCSTHGKSLDVIDFVMKKEEISKHEAIKKCESLINPTTPKQVTPADNNENLGKVFKQLQENLPKSRKANDYLKSRNLHHTDLEIGCNHQTNINGKTGFYYPHLKNCIIFPLKNCHGQTVSFYGRSIVNNDKSKHFYTSNRQGLYPSYPAAETKKIIITESIIDAATLLNHLDYEVLALFGTNGLTNEHKQSIKELRELEEIILWLDGDTAGEKATEKYAIELRELLPKITITKVDTPKDEDINSLLDGHEPTILTQLLENRTSFLIKNPTETNNLNTSAPSHLNTSNPYNLKYTGQEANYEIKGFKQNQHDSLKVTLRIITKGEIKRGITLKLDLYEYSQLEKSSKTGAEKLQLDKGGIEEDLEELTTQLETYKSEKTNKNKHNNKETVTIPAETATKCIEFLKRENLIAEFNKLIGKAGIVGEEENRILLFIIASSYGMKDTLHALIQGSSGSGKTRLLKVISELMPKEDVKRYTRVTDNSFYNQEEYFFVNKLICFEDLDGLKEEAQLAVRELQSNEILISSTSIKDKDGGISGGERTVRGPIGSLSCTTRGEIYEDNVSRSFLVAVDESAGQTTNIINYQNQQAAGKINKEEQQKIKYFVQNCMRLLKPYEVINPFADKIQLPKEAHKIRRLNELYQCFVRQITLLNQYKRRISADNKLITEKEDLEVACEILFESIVLKVDELDGSLRQFFERLKSFVIDKAGKESVEVYELSFTQREIRQELNISKSQCSRFFIKLQGMEYLQSKFSQNQRKVKYQIDYWDDYSKLRGKIKEDLVGQINQLA